ncbi:polyketide cyclase [Altererythrobacter salegens]|uniref:Polyketide cyclase n=1 Tax=Croceibacterium salegens TaxID=1737568 RepID=A0A6I4SYD6_9SPHN|nr:nuclear transport factor 2 family protein [Croceibacterium salegens]MXO60379.1 polyketide cyclase [Croceibacterium salegens]
MSIQAKKASRIFLGSALTILLARSALAETPEDTREACNLQPSEVVEKFVDMLFMQKLVRPAFETWVVEDYIQHKPSMGDGRETVIRFLEDIFERMPDRSYRIHRVIASGDLVAVHYHTQANANELGLAIVDIFRVRNCKIVEHWDVVQPVPETSQNDNTMF